VGDWQIGARVVDIGEAFHDHSRYIPPYPWKDHWRRDITRESLAVHKCKTPELLSSAFAELCSFS
jgi:hypothetical protein